jgi:hypothetical protein
MWKVGTEPGQGGGYNQATNHTGLGLSQEI